MKSYSDDDLTAAVAASRSWRGVLRALGLNGTSAGAMRSARRTADRLGLDYSHFTGQRRWSDRDLEDAVSASRSWSQVLERLGLVSDSGTVTVRGHAVRLGLDTSHFTSAKHAVSPPTETLDRNNLRRAGSLLAASWFELNGDEVAWPLEPCRYDLDQFFVVDGDLAMYLIPIGVVAGRWGIRLSAYESFRLPPLTSLT